MLLIYNKCVFLQSQRMNFIGFKKTAFSINQNTMHDKIKS
jgi:hypothetical protein